MNSRALMDHLRSNPGVVLRGEGRQSKGRGRPRVIWRYYLENGHDQTRISATVVGGLVASKAIKPVGNEMHPCYVLLTE